jgi:hypothetical protein
MSAEDQRCAGQDIIPGWPGDGRNLEPPPCTPRTAERGCRRYRGSQSSSWGTTCKPISGPNRGSTWRTSISFKPLAGSTLCSPPDSENSKDSSLTFRLGTQLRSTRGSPVSIAIWTHGAELMMVRAHSRMQNNERFWRSPSARSVSS